MTQLFRVLGAALLLAGLVACEGNSHKLFKKDQQFQIRVTGNAHVSEEPMPKSFDPTLYSDKDLVTYDALSQIWVNYPINPISFVHPTLFLKRCFNIAAIGTKDGILYQEDMNPNSPSSVGNLRRPFISLPSSKITHIAMLIKRSPRTGLVPDCKDILIGDETILIRHFALSNAPEVLIGYLFVILAVIYVLTWPIHKNKRILAVGFFHFSLAGVFIFKTHVTNFINSNTHELFIAWTLSLLASPVAASTLLYQLLGKKYQALRGIAWINATCAAIIFALLMLGFDQAHQALRNLYFVLALLQMGAILPILGAQVLFSPNRTFSTTYIGFMVFILSIYADVYAHLFIGELFHASAIGGFIYLLAGISTFARHEFLNANRETAKNRTEAEEYTRRLEAEVTQREERLRERSRQLEESNIELEEKNILLRMAFKRLDDLVYQQSSMLKKASKIKTSIMPELKESRELTRTQFDRDSLRTLSEVIHKLASALDPFARLHDNIVAINNKQVWILTSNKAVETHYKNALNSSKLQIQCFSAADIMMETLKQNKPELVIICAQHAGLIADIGATHRDIQIIVAGERDFTTSIDILRQTSELNHLIAQQIDMPFFMQRNLLVTTTKMLSNDIFGIEKYLDWGVDIKETIISGNYSRGKALDQLNRDLNRAGLSSTIVHRAHHLADELLMNAIYDAPVDPHTKLSRYNHLRRSVNVELDPSEYARLRYGYDGTILAISIDDPFGGLKREIILKYLKACFDGQFGTINELEGKGGGGMGLFQIMSSADLFVTNIKPERKTEIIVLINVHEKSSHKGQCFHYFVDRDAQ